MRCMHMNAIRAMIMSKTQNSIRGRHFAGAVLTMGVLALSAAYVVPADAPMQTAGTSMHAKNSATPDWMLNLETRDAGQLPVTVQNNEPSFWI
jgi:hypothetical protein